MAPAARILPPVGALCPRCRHRPLEGVVTNAMLAWSLLALLTVGAAPALAEEIGGQTSIPIVGDTFSFQPGTWSSYQVEDRTRNERYQLWIATLERRAAKNGSTWWLETRVAPPAGPSVVTRILVPETPAGPGEALQAVVQIEGKTPFTVPRKYLRGEKREVTSFRLVTLIETGTGHVVRIGDRELVAVDVIASDAEGRRVSATTSGSVSPLGLVVADTGDIRLDLEDWGTGAVTRIEGKPVSLFWWILTETFANASPDD